MVQTAAVQRTSERREEQRNSNDQHELDEHEEHGHEQARVDGGRLPRAAHVRRLPQDTHASTTNTIAPITARFTRTVSTSPAYLPITSSDRRTGFASRL